MKQLVIVMQQKVAVTQQEVIVIWQDKFTSLLLADCARNMNIGLPHVPGDGKTACSSCCFILLHRLQPHILKGTEINWNIMFVRQCFNCVQNAYTMDSEAGIHQIGSDTDRAP